ncbi:hypothetical protein PYJP_08250 [Pyrofollis japonicus]|nr:hypothetical protein PYJP_08250 [Pyrofollis japonicus]
MGVNPVEHYLRGGVLAEMAEWLQGRWVAVAGKKGEENIFIRHMGPGRPLRVRGPEDLRRLVIRYKSVIRTIYGSVNIYSRLESDNDLENPGNIVATTPSWDIDASIDKWRFAVEAAKIIVSALEEHGVKHSVYLVWSGEGIHVHINENAFSQSLRENIHPFNAAYAVVEYILLETRHRLIELAKRSGGILKVENIMDVKRVFTAPLSLHREHDLVAVVFTPDKLDEFDIEWARPSNFKHQAYAWKQYKEGEADALAEEAVKKLGLRYKLWKGLKTRRQVVSIQSTREQGVTEAGEKPRIGRFEVMALLQAARYYLLTGDLDKAKSFGLNRAIFYAWAKYYGPSGRYGRVAASRQAKSLQEKKFVKALGEEVPVGPNGYFEMGGKEQRPEDFDRQIKAKFEALMPWAQVWRKALEYVSKFPRSVLRDPQKFYQEVYLPVRDTFVEKILLGKEEKRKSILDFIGGRKKSENDNREGSERA